MFYSESVFITFNIVTIIQLIQRLRTVHPDVVYKFSSWKDQLLRECHFAEHIKWLFQIRTKPRRRPRHNDSVRMSPRPPWPRPPPSRRLRPFWPRCCCDRPQRVCRRRRQRGIHRGPVSELGWGLWLKCQDMRIGRLCHGRVLKTTLKDLQRM